MNLLKKLASGSLTVSLLASLFAVSAGTAFGATTATQPSNSVGSVPTAISVGTVTFALGADITGTGTFTLTLPAGYTWATSGTITTTESGAGFAVANGTMAAGGTVTFVASALPVSFPATLAFSGGKVVAASPSSAPGNISLTYSGAWSGGTLVVAAVTPLAPSGTAVPYLASATSIPADGVSTIVFTFGTAVPGANTISITTSAGKFISASGTGWSPALAIPAGGVTAVNNITAIAAGATLTLQSATTAGPAVVTVRLTPTVGSPTTDSTRTFHFTAGGGRDGDRGMGKGARKVGLFLAPAWACDTGAQPSAGASTYGFAILNRIGRGKHTAGYGKLNVNVVLKGALPDATYDVWVNQYPGICPLASATKVGAVTTNAQGNGTGHLKVAIVSGANRFWVSATSGGSVLRTRAAVLNVKHH